MSSLKLERPLREMHRSAGLWLEWLQCGVSDGRKGRRPAQLNAEADALFFSSAHAAAHDRPEPRKR